MNPVTGPVAKTTYVGGYSTSRYTVRSTYKQAKPYDLRLPYRVCDTITLSGNEKLIEKPMLAWSYGGTLWSPCNRDTTGDLNYANLTSAETNAVNDAVKRFSKGMGDKAALGVALAQRREAITMIANRAKQLFTVVKSLKRFDVIGAAKALGYSPWEAEKRHRAWARSGRSGPYTRAGVDIWKPGFRESIKRRDRARAFSGLWLEYSFGWAPLVDDVRSAVKILTKGPIPPSSLKTRGQSSRSYNYQENVTDNLYHYVRRAKHDVRVFCVIGGTITVTNENLSLASKLGLTSLAAIAYEVVPFSFVLNYFVNVEEYISQYSQYEGVTVSQAWYTTRWEDTISHTSTRQYKDPLGAPQPICEYVQRTTDVKRFIGSLPVTRLSVRPVYHNGIKRALNNVSLLIQLFIKGR